MCDTRNQSDVDPDRPTGRPKTADEEHVLVEGRAEGQNADGLRPAGWYPNPADASAVRWWDGAGWTKMVGTVLASEEDVFHSAGLFDYVTPADSSQVYSERLKEIRSRTKEMIRDGTAIERSETSLYRNSAARAQLPEAAQRALTDLILSAFNSHAESAIRSLTFENFLGRQGRIYKAFDAANRAGRSLGLRISLDYCNLRVDELRTGWEHLAAKRMEAAAAADRRTALREENRVQAELALERAKLEKEQEHYLNALAALRANGDTEGAQRMEQLLEEIRQKIADVDYRAANIRAGYVYVISNVGAFGGGIVKIGMTRRLEPMDRIKELSNASVPFRYDVHAMFFSTDAVTIEALLHRTFDEHRVNKINRRREFFYVRPDQVLAVLQEHTVELVEWTETAAAAEYRMGLGLGTEDGAEF